MQRYLSSLPQSIPPWAYVAFAVFMITWPFGVANFWVFLGAAACLYAIASLGLTVLVGWAGEVSLAHAGVVGSTVYVSGYAVRQGTPYWLAIPLAMVIGAVLYGLVSLPTARISGIYVMVLTLGLQVTIERTIFTSPTLTGGADAVFVQRPIFFGTELETDRAYYYVTLAALALVLFLLTLFRTSRHGRAMLLVKTDRRAAQAVGIAPWRYKTLAFLMAGALAGFAGGLTPGLYRSPPTSLQYLAIPALLYLAVPVTAGFESLIAVVVVAFAFQMIPQALEGINLSPFVVGGVALLLGTFVGSRGLGGVALDALRRTGLTRSVAATGGASAAVVDAYVPVPAVAAGSNGNGRPRSNGNGSATGRPRLTIDRTEPYIPAPAAAPSGTGNGNGTSTRSTRAAGGRPRPTIGAEPNGNGDAPIQLRRR